MKRSEIKVALSELHPKLEQLEIKQLMNGLIDQLSTDIINKQRIEIRWFGSFSCKTSNREWVMNPRDNVKLQRRHASDWVYFRPGKELKARINKINS